MYIFVCQCKMQIAQRVSIRRVSCCSAYLMMLVRHRIQNLQSRDINELYLYLLHALLLQEPPSLYTTNLGVFLISVWFPMRFCDSTTTTSRSFFILPPPPPGGGKSKLQWLLLAQTTAPGNTSAIHREHLRFHPPQPQVWPHHLPQNCPRSWSLVT